MPLYPEGDPRGAEILSRIDEVGGRADRQAVVERVLDVGAGRGFPPPNVDMALGALAYCAEMVPGAGQAIARFGRVAGWLAHAMEEYSNPTRFRTRAAYMGAGPSRMDRVSREGGVGRDRGPAARPSSARRSAGVPGSAGMAPAAGSTGPPARWRSLSGAGS